MNSAPRSLKVEAGELNRWPERTRYRRVWFRVPPNERALLASVMHQDFAGQRVIISFVKLRRKGDWQYK